MNPFGLQKKWRLIFSVIFVGALAASCQTGNSVSNPAEDSYLQQFAAGPLTVSLLPMPTSAAQSPDFVLQFSQPMVGFEDLARLRSKVEGVDLQPRQKGQFEWVTPQTLLFRGSDRTDFGTTQITVAAGWVSKLGFALLRPANFSFSKTAFSTTSPQPLMSEKPTNTAFAIGMEEGPAIPLAPPPIRALWLLPDELRVGDSVHAVLRILNDSTTEVTFSAQLDGDALFSKISRQFTLNPGETYDWTFDVVVPDDWQNKAVAAFLQDAAATVPQELKFSWQTETVSGSSARTLPIRPQGELVLENHIGVLFSPQMTTLLRSDLSEFETGELIVTFALMPQPLMQGFDVYPDAADGGDALSGDSQNLDFETLNATAQMQLAAKMLQENSAHPVGRQVKRNVDKSLADDLDLPLEYWVNAFEALLFVNPNDSLAYEALAKVFSYDLSRLKPSERYRALEAFWFYQHRVGDVNQTVDLEFTINGQTVLKPHLTVRKPIQDYKLPFKILPKDLSVAATRTEGTFAFFRTDFRAIRQQSALPLEQNGATFGHKCYDAAGQVVVSGFAVGQSYTCHLRWVLDADASGVSIQIPVPPLAQIDIAETTQFWHAEHVGDNLQIRADSLNRGFYDFSYTLSPILPGRFSAPPITLNANANVFVRQAPSHFLVQ